MTTEREEAIVKSALERAAVNIQNRPWPDDWKWTASVLADGIRSIADNPKVVAEIIAEAAKEKE